MSQIPTITRKKSRIGTLIHQLRTIHETARSPASATPESPMLSSRRNSPRHALRMLSSVSSRRSENTHRRKSTSSAIGGHSTMTPMTIVRRRPQPRRSAAPTSAPNAAHPLIVVSAAVPITRNPTMPAAIAPATTARSRCREPTTARGTTAATSSAPPNGTTWPTTVSASDRSARTTASASSAGRRGPVRVVECIGPGSRTREAGGGSGPRRRRRTPVYAGGPSLSVTDSEWLPPEASIQPTVTFSPGWNTVSAR